MRRVLFALPLSLLIACAASTDEPTEGETADLPSMEEGKLEPQARPDAGPGRIIDLPTPKTAPDPCAGINGGGWFEWRFCGGKYFQ